MLDTNIPHTHEYNHPDLTDQNPTPFIHYVQYQTIAYINRPTVSRKRYPSLGPIIL
jgi:hypothetical protein